ncbi:MAG: heavy-metal-associated domain-containing protein [Thermodesulfobacteriota bacterium]
MEKTFKVPKISCHHCVAAIKNELVTVKGVTKVEGDPGKKQVTVSWNAPADEAAIRKAMEEINYPAD